MSAVVGHLPMPLDGLVAKHESLFRELQRIAAVGAAGKSERHEIVLDPAAQAYTSLLDRAQKLAQPKAA